MFGNKVSYPYMDLSPKSHWIVYEGNLKFYDKQGRDTASIKDAASLSFDFFTWGRNPKAAMKETMEVSKLSVESFKSTCYGYIICSYT